VKKQTYIYKSFERFWHWSQALLIFFLILTGFEIHSSYKLMGFQNAVKWHDTAGWAFLVLIIFAIFWHFVTGEWKQYVPTMRFGKEQFRYYISGIFKGAPHPTKKTRYNKLNPLQRLIYLGLKLLVIPIQVLTGFIYMFYVYPDNPLHVSTIGGIAVIHTIGAFGLIIFIIAHIYLTTTGEKVFTSIKAMITGWEVVDVDEKEEHIKHMQDAVDKSVAGYYRLDKKGVFIDVNKAWLHMFGYDKPEEIIGKHYSIAREEKYMKRLDDLVEDILKGNKVIGIPAVRKNKDGSTGKHILSANPVIENNEIIGLEGFILDINEEEHYSQHMYDAVRNSQAGYYRLSSDGYFEDVNKAWLDYYKYENKEEVIGKHYSFSRCEKDLETLNNIFKRVTIDGEKISSIIATRKCKDGSTGKHLLSANPIYQKDKIIGMEGFILNLPEEK
jgi:PAS domain S-box-containing protein